MHALALYSYANVPARQQTSPQLLPSYLVHCESSNESFALIYFSTDASHDCKNVQGHEKARFLLLWQHSVCIAYPLPQIPRAHIPGAHPLCC
jgi:hypothetical protein